MSVNGASNIPSVSEALSIHSPLTTYLGRLKTFPDSWNKNHPQRSLSAEVMAKAGFYFLIGDTVKCYYCFKELENWEADDDVYEEHKKHSSCCPFVKMFPIAPNTVTCQQALELERDRLLLKMDREFDEWAAQFPASFENDLKKVQNEIEKSKKNKNKKIKKVFGKWTG